ncbi:MAG: CAP domain-containing protein [Candidatus Paceibacterota bacterium]|jgi:hypothetical protein
MRKPILHHLHDYFFPHPRNNHCPHLFSTASLAVLAIAIVIFEAGYLVQTKIVFLRTDFLASVLPGALVALTNQDRATLGVAGVAEDPLLNKAAAAAAADMAANGYFAHVSPGGKEPWYWLDSVGYRYSYAGQNLAVNFTDSENVETAWMASPTHRANIEKPQYTRVGIGTAHGVYEGRETTFVVAFFATPASAEAHVASVEVKPPQNISTNVRDVSRPLATTSVQVLGTEIVDTDAGSAAVDADSVPPKAPPSRLARMLASPSTMLQVILTALFALVAVSFIVVMFVRGKDHHPRVALGAALLCLLISGALIVSALAAGPVLLLV